MSSTILSSLGEPVLHSNSLATVTDSWVVVRWRHVGTQSIILIDSIATVKSLKTRQFHFLTCAMGSLVLAAATLRSKEADGTTLPFALLGLALVVSARVTQRAAIAFVVENETIQTNFGTLREAAKLLAAVRSAQVGKRGDFLAWIREYVGLLL
jgi:DMSO reductase anchor subunit